MLLFVDETENDNFFIVTGLLVQSQNDINMSFNRFKKHAKNLNISSKKKAQLFTEFKSTLMDRNYQKLKIAMLSELNSIEHCIIYSCYIKKDFTFPQTLKEDTYIYLLSQIVNATTDSIDIIFDTFNKRDFEEKIISKISSLQNVSSIKSCDSQQNPGLQYADNLCSTCRHYLNGDDTNHFYDIIKENVKEV